MNNPKKLAKLGTQEENKQNKAQSGADPETLLTYFSSPLKTLVVELFNICSAV
jgi:hypothetical protein